jgi:hypothetical protein
MIRLTIKIADDIRRALFKVKESMAYERFLGELKDLEEKNRYREISNEENNILYKRRIVVLKKIHEQTDAVLYALVNNLKSKRREDFYVKKAIRAYARFKRHLLTEAQIIIPEIYPDLKYELENSNNYFNLNKIL